MLLLKRRHVSSVVVRVHARLVRGVAPAVLLPELLLVPRQPGQFISFHLMSARSGLRSRGSSCSCSISFRRRIRRWPLFLSYMTATSTTKTTTTTTTRRNSNQPLSLIVNCNKNRLRSCGRRRRMRNIDVKNNNYNNSINNNNYNNKLRVIRSCTPQHECFLAHFTVIIRHRFSHRVACFNL